MEEKNRHEDGTDFSGKIYRRIRKQIRQTGKFKKDEKVLAEDEISEHFLKNMHVEIVKNGEYDKKVKTWTADDEINSFFMNMISGKADEDKKLVKIFTCVTDEELEKYCKLNKIMFKRREKDQAVQKFVDDISLKHTDSKHKIIKSLERLHHL